jgi:branched-chain amino acid transport system substrate-binding protein
MHMRRSLFSGIGTIFATLALAACGGGAAPAASSAPPAASSPAAAASKPAAASPAASKPAATAGASAAASAKPAASGSASAKPVASGSAAAKPAAGGPIKVGYINSTTGSLANVGKDNDDAFQLYLDSIQSTVAGRKIEVTYADAAAQPDTGLTKAKQLVESNGVNVLMGITATPVCYAVAGYVKQAQVPLIVSGNCGAESLMYDPKNASPYIVRFTQNGTGITDPLADYGYKKGYRKAILITSDYGGGLETGDGFASAFVGRGGSIVQEIHPPLGTNDMGPYASQIGSNGDVLVTFMPGIDSLRFAEAYSTYAGNSNRPVLDHFGGMISGSNFAQAKDKVVGVTGDYAYSPALDTPGNQALLKAWNAKYSNRPVSTDTGVGWSAGQILEAAIKQVNGNVEDKQAFMNALYNLKIDTAKGPLSLDKEHDVVQNIYFWQAAKEGNGVGLKVVDTYKDISRTWDRTQAQIEKFQFGSYKGKWVGMTQQQLGDVLTLPK